MSVWMDGEPLNDESGYVREDPDELGYFAGEARPPQFFDTEDDEWVEECEACDGEGMRIDPGRQLFICPDCGGSGTLPHDCREA